MKYLSLATLFILALSSCDPQDCCRKLTSSCPENYSCTFLIHSDGDERSFVYTSTNHDDPSIMDDELTIILSFKVPASDEASFKYADSQLAGIGATLNYHCGECCGGSYPVAMGSIEGEKMANSNWLVRIEVKAEWNCGSHKVSHEVSLKEVFTR